MRATALLLATLLPCSAMAAQPTIKTEKDELSYTIGVNLGKQFKNQDMDINIDIFRQGVEHSLQGKDLMLTDEKMAATMNAFQQQQMSKMQDKHKKLATVNKKESDAFLKANKGKKDVKTLASGLQYIVMETGNGTSPGPNDTVEVHYRGTLVDGTEFDSSHKRGQPATFKVNGVIPGWTEALQLMKPGGKWKLFLPPELAYGERGASGVIGPNAALIFEVELLSVKDKA